MILKFASEVSPEVSSKLYTVPQRPSVARTHARRAHSPLAEKSDAPRGTRR